MNINHLMGVIIVWAMYIFMWTITLLPVTAQTPKVEVQTTAHLGDGTTLHVGISNVHLRLVRFQEGTVCIVGVASNSATKIQLECDFSRSVTIQKQ